MRRAKVPKTQAEEIKLLSRRITESGMSPREFAEDVLTRDERTMRRWLKGQTRIPRRVLEFLVAPWVVPWPAEAT